LDKKVAFLEDDAKMNRTILLRMEDGLKEKVDIQGDQIYIAYQHIDRIEDHLQIPHALSA
jgi:hypothetical protein